MGFLAEQPQVQKLRHNQPCVFQASAPTPRLGTFDAGTRQLTPNVVIARLLTEVTAQLIQKNSL